MDVGKMQMTRPTLGLKARTHRPILRVFVAESAVELAYSIPESADSTTDFRIVYCRCCCRTIAVGGLQIGLVGMGL